MTTDDLDNEVIGRGLGRDITRKFSVVTTWQLVVQFERIC